MRRATRMGPVPVRGGARSRAPAPANLPFATLPATRVAKTLPPGRAGTRRLAQRYGAALVCVRHRRDRLGLYRYVTVELVIDAAPRRPLMFATASFGVDLGDDPPEALTALLTEGGARWDRRERLWWVKGALIEQLGLVDRIRRV